ncbi:MAG: hypothetical protein LBQ94_01570 [Treponema sp.]|nr:hypothetical protein [Treponema sp.]
MSCKRLLSIALLFLLFTFSASASTISFLVVETGLSNGTASPQNSSRIWEEGLMAFFFDAGHIVTNNPILRMDEQVPAEIHGTIVEYDFNEAVTGGAEYFVLGFLEYEIQGSRAAAVRMNIKIYSTLPEELVYEQVFPAGRSTAEENQLVRNAGRTIISYIKDR